MRRATPRPVVPPAQAGEDVAGRLAERAAPAVRPRAEVHAEEPRRASPSSPSSRSPTRRAASTYRVAIRGPAAWRQLLHLPRLRHQHAGHLQAHRVHAGPAGAAAAAARAALRRGFQPPYSEVFLQYGARREVRFRPGTRVPARRSPRWPTKYFDADGSAAPEAFATFETFLAEAAELDHELRCCDDVLGFVAEVRDAARRQQRIAEAFPRGIRSAGVQEAAQGASSTTTSAKARCSPRAPAAA